MAAKKKRPAPKNQRKAIKPTDTIPVDAKRAVLPISGFKAGKRKT